MEENKIDKARLKEFFDDKSSDDSSYIASVFTDDSQKIQLQSILEHQFDELQYDNLEDQKRLNQLYYKIYYNITSKGQTFTQTRNNQFIKWASIGAAIIAIPLVLFLGIQTYQTRTREINTWVEIKAPAWTRAQFSLPDGSTGWLNSNSVIRYRGNYSRERTIVLNGEAFFEVVKNPSKPFIVQTDNIDVKVLGTKFNVASYKNERNIEVVLEEGKLVFENKPSGQTYTLKPNDLVVFDKLKKKYAVRKVLSGKYTSWKEGKLIFRNDPVDVIVRRLERWYNVVIINKIPANEDFRWRATFQDESIEKVLDLMKRTLPIDFSLEEAKVDKFDSYLKKKVIITLKK